MPSKTVQEFRLFHFLSFSFYIFLTSPLLYKFLLLAPVSSMQLDGGLHCQGFGSSINRLWGRGTPASNVALSVSSPLSLLLLLLPQQEKSKGDGGARWRLPLFLTLVRKPSLLLYGEWHLLITIETLWEVPPLPHWGRDLPPLPG